MEIFENQLANLNISDIVENVTVVSMDISGIPGISALFPCFAGVPTKTTVRLINNKITCWVLAFALPPPYWRVVQCQSELNMMATRSKTSLKSCLLECCESHLLALWSDEAGWQRGQLWPRLSKVVDLVYS